MGDAVGVAEVPATAGEGLTAVVVVAGAGGTAAVVAGAGDPAASSGEGEGLASAPGEGEGLRECACAAKGGE